MAANELPATSLGVALLGTGAAATAHVAALRHLHLPPPTWVVGRSKAQARSFADASGIRSATDDRRFALDDSDVTLVVVATPSSQHPEHAMDALAAGKHALVEVPIALSVALAESVMQAGVTSGKRVFVCHTLRSMPALREVRRRAESGALEISQVSGTFTIPRRDNEGWSGRPRTWTDSLMWHHACHQVDASLWVLGLPSIKHVAAVEGPLHERHGMAMDLGLVAVTDADQVIVQSLSYNTSILHWELRFMSRIDSLVFRNGALIDERGSELVPEASVRDFRDVWSIVIRSLDAGLPSDLDLEAILPSMRVLGRAADTLETHR